MGESQEEDKRNWQKRSRESIRTADGECKVAWMKRSRKILRKQREKYKNDNENCERINEKFNAHLKRKTNKKKPQKMKSVKKDKKYKNRLSNWENGAGTFLWWWKNVWEHQVKNCLFSLLYLVFYLQRTLTTKWLKTNWFKSQYLHIAQWLVNFPIERISRAERKSKYCFKTCVCISLVRLFSQRICLICGPASDNNRVLTLNRTFPANQCSMIVAPGFEWGSFWK